MSFVNEYGFPVDATYRAVLSADVKGNGGFRIAGTFDRGSGLVAAIKTEGTSEWQKVYTVNGGGDIYFWTGVRCDDGDLLVHGSMAKSAGLNETLIVRLKPDGGVRWAKTYTSDRTRYNVRLVKGIGDTYFFAGWYNESGTVDDVEVVRIDGAGNVLAAVILHTMYDDQLSSLIPYNQGCIVTGGTGVEGWSGFVAALDSDLHVMWGRLIGAAGFQQIDAIVQIDGANFVIAGQTGDKRQPFIAAFRPGDHSLTAAVYSFGSGDESGPKRLIRSSSGNLYLAAVLGAASVVARFHPNLNPAWVKRLAVPGEWYVADIVDAGDGEQGLAVCGMVLGAPPTKPLLAYTDLQFTSCVTADLRKRDPIVTQFDVKYWTNLELKPVVMQVTDRKIDVRPLTPALDELCPVETPIDLTDAEVQSPYIYMQAAGSDASDDTVRGFHLRWDLLRRLGEAHLPKGNLAAPGGPWPTTIGYNRADDFVRIYKTPLQSDFGVDVHFQLPPTSTFKSGSVREWLYEDLVPFTGRTTDVSIRFLDVAQYDTLRASIDPMAEPQQFIAEYHGVIEARAIGKLAFLARFQLTGSGGAKTGTFRVEAIGIADRLDNHSRRVVCRRRWTLLETEPIVCENIESLRFDYSGYIPTTLHIATYEDFLYGVAERKLWKKVGDFSLDDGNADANVSVFRRLEDQPAVSIDNAWPKFQRLPEPGLARVAAQNYRDRWTMPDNGLKQGVTTYLDASRTDVKANVEVANSDPVTNKSSMELSYLDLLNFVALDHHVARMLGLGTIDASATVTPADQFIYLMQYVTEGQLETETPHRVLHCYMTQPTSIIDYRLPPPPNITLSYGLPPEECGGTTTALTDAAGYAKFDSVRFVNLDRAPFRHEKPMESFFQTADEFCLCEEGVPVAFGVSYGAGPIGAGDEVQPELSHNEAWRDPSGIDEVAPIPDRAMNPVYTHGERDAGVHHYRLYSINWFSRTGKPSNEVQTDATAFTARSTLLPPSAFAVQLIQPEDPLILTTDAEQKRLALLPDGDQTLVRVTFDWNHIQNQAYISADAVELFFRTAQAAVVRGKIATVTKDTATHTVTITTTRYFITSTNVPQTVQPQIDAADMQRFVGARLGARGEGWIVKSITSTGLNPTLVLEQIRRTDSISVKLDNEFCTVETWISPNSGDLFLLPENLNQTAVWDLQLKKEVPLTQFSPPYMEFVVNNDGTSRTVILGGLADSAFVEDVPDPDPNIGTFIPSGGPLAVPTGAYKVTFNSQKLTPPADPDVEFHEGVFRIRDLNGKMKVLRVWSIDTTRPTLELVVYDSEFGLRRDPTTKQFKLDNSNHFVPVPGYVPIQIGSVLTVNFHPSYRVYLTVDAVHPETFGEGTILPAKHEGTRQTLMTARSKDSKTSPLLTSSMAKAAVLVARELHEAAPPAEPIGPLYATRPNVYGKSTYTFDVQVDDPHSIIFYKANERKILDQLYEPATARQLAAALETLSGADLEFSPKRWRDLVHLVTDGNGDLLRYVPDGLRFPTPDNADYAIPDPNPDAPAVYPFKNNTTPPGSGTLVAGAQRSMRDVVREAIEGAFIPLTELPLVYRQLTDDTMQTSGRPPKLPKDDPWPMAIRYEKNAKGEVLQKGNAGYGDPANTRWVRITDYTLDGASTNIYFYFAVELTDQMRVSERSGVAGPVQLVNSMSPAAPAIRDVRVRAANEALGIAAAIVVQANPYSAAERVVQLRLYRALDAQAAQSVRTMTLVTTAAAGGELVDDFSDLGVIPFGDPLFYRVVAMRRFSNEQGREELAPSWPSEMRTAQMIDDVVPPAPELSFTYGTPIAGPPVLFPGVTLTWKRAAWKPRYHLFRMNALGNWVKLHTLATNDALVTLDLAATDLGTNVLPKQNAAGETIYHRFKVVTENSGGLLSSEEKAIVI